MGIMFSLFGTTWVAEQNTNLCTWDSPDKFFFSFFFLFL